MNGWLSKGFLWAANATIPLISPYGISCRIIGEELASLTQHPAELCVVLVGHCGSAGLPVRGHEALPDVLKEAKWDPPPK